MNEDDNVLAWVFTGVVSFCYLIMGLELSDSGVGNVLIVLIYAAVATFVARNILRDEVSDARGFSGMVFIVSSIIFTYLRSNLG